MTARLIHPTARTGARRFGIALVVAAGFSMATTSTMAFAHDVHAEESETVSVIGLRQGSQGPGVVAVQKKLIGFGYYVAGGADGVFGPGTTSALSVFQRQNGLNPTGVVTENTARYLGLAGGAPASPSARQSPSPSAPAAGSVVGLRRGMSGEAVRQLQLAILATGLVLRGGADGMFGPSTERAVTLVQRVNGLPETGSVDTATAGVLGLTGSASSPTPSPAGAVLAIGSTGRPVTRMQQMLITAGINLPGGADGVFGPQTRRAVESFQRLHNLSQTGKVDAATDAALVRASNRNTTPSNSSGYVGLRLGSTGPAVTKLQQAIMATGLFLRGGADGVFGPVTATGVRSVQRVNGFPETGVVDEATARVLGLLSGSGGTSTGGGGGGSTANGYAKYDERGSRVVALQRALIRAGIAVRGGADGMFGSGTAGAVMKFQRQRGLRVTGRVDQATANALGLQALPAPSPAPVVTVPLQAKPLASGPCWYGDTWQASRGAGRVHLGVDIGAPARTPVQAVATGRVTQIYRDRPGSLSGNGLKITTANGTYFFYAHLDGFAAGIGLGVPVTAGQVIGYMGRTGNAGMTHLHLEVHPGGGSAVNPYTLVRAIGAC
jgi:peptidoglycan hydrolase-like protein with peptidoglycan-binding domain